MRSGITCDGSTCRTTKPLSVSPRALELFAQSSSRGGEDYQSGNVMLGPLSASGQQVPLPDGSSLHCMVDDCLWPWEHSIPVLLQHGLARNAGFFRRWIPQLIGTRRVLRPELRGCGQSPSPADSFRFTVDAMVEDLVVAMDFFHIDQVHFVGESSGGMLGVLLAMRAPERVTSLVLCETPLAIPQQISTGLSLGEPSPGDAIRRNGLTHWAETTLSGRLDTVVAPPEMLPWYVNELSSVSTSVAAQMLDTFQRVDLTVPFSELPVPTLLIYGERDSIISEARVSARRAGASFKLIPNCAHGVSILRSVECSQLAL